MTEGGRSQRMPERCRRALAKAESMLAGASGRNIAAALALAALILRLPFLFRAHIQVAGPFQLTSADEAVFMLEGMDVLRFHLPYVHHFDGAPPFLWYVYGLLMLMTGGSLTLLRLFGIAYTACTALVVYRALADGGHKKEGLWAAAFFLLYACTLPGAQSVTREMLVSLPVAAIAYMLLNPASQRGRCWLIAAFTASVLMMPRLAWLLPAIAWLTMPASRYPRYYVFAYNAARCALPALLGYAAFWILYALQGKSALLISALLDDEQPGYVGGTASLKYYFTAYLNSSYWLISFFVLCFLVQAGYRSFRLRDTSMPHVPRILALLGCAFLVIWARMNHEVSLYYLQPVLPVLCLAMGCVLSFDWRDARLLMRMAAMLGILSPLRLALIFYLPLAAYAAGRHDRPAFYNDHQYSIARIINTAQGLKGRDVFICEGDDMVYLLTGTDPFRYRLRYPILPPHPADTRVRAAYRRALRDARPRFVAAKLGSTCATSLDDMLMTQFAHVSTIGKTAVYVRKDVFYSILRESK